MQYRTVMGLAPTVPLPMRQLAKHLAVRVLAVEEVPSLSRAVITQLTKKDSDGWSALMVTHRGVNVVVMNSSHSSGRQSSSLAHECSHVILNHKPLQAIQSPAGTFVSTYDRQQEDEADWLAGTLLLPRVALLKIAQQGVNQPHHARDYDVSEDMLRMRLDRTGVSFQMRRKAS